MDITDSASDEVELRLQAHAFEAFWETRRLAGVSRRTVPDHPDMRVVRIIENLLDHRNVRRPVPVLFQPELHAKTVAHISGLGHRLADLLENLFSVRIALIGHCVGKYPYAERADVRRELKELLGAIDVSPQLRLIRRVKLIGARQADGEPGVGKALSDLRALGLGQRQLDAVLVGGAELDVLEFGFLAVLDEGRDIP